MTIKISHCFYWGRLLLEEAVSLSSPPSAGAPVPGLGVTPKPKQEQFGSYM